MAGRIIRSGEVARDLDDIFGDICRNNGLAVAVAQMERLERTLERLGDFPGLGRRRANIKGRPFVFPAPPWSIVYEVAGDDLHVLRIVDGRRDLSAALHEKP